MPTQLVGMSTRLLDAALTAATMRLKLARKEVRADAVGGLEDYLDVEQTWNLESFGNVMDALVSLLLAMEDGDVRLLGRAGAMRIVAVQTADRLSCGRAGGLPTDDAPWTSQATSRRPSEPVRCQCLHPARAQAPRHCDCDSCGRHR